MLLGGAGFGGQAHHGPGRGRERGKVRAYPIRGEAPYSKYMLSDFTTFLDREASDDEMMD